MIHWIFICRAGDLQPFQNCTGKNTQVCEEFYFEQSCTVLLNDFLYTIEYEVTVGKPVAK